jgi:hypothetical protein
MKKYLVLMIIVAMATTVFAQPKLPEYQPAAGKWMLTADRLYQNDAAERLAKINIRIPQVGKMVYPFNARYEGGAEDGHGGFGIHLFADTAHPGRSWGSGKSYLLWINYDLKPVSKDIPKGFSAQVYRSDSHSKMTLVQSVDLNRFAYLLTPAVLANPIPIKIWVDSATGEVRFYDPTQANYYYRLDLGKDFPKIGQWVAVRTNGMKVSFGLTE